MPQWTPYFFGFCYLKKSVIWGWHFCQTAQQPYISNDATTILNYQQTKISKTNGKIEDSGIHIHGSPQEFQLCFHLFRLLLRIHTKLGRHECNVCTPFKKNWLHRLHGIDISHKITQPSIATPTAIK